MLDVASKEFSRVVILTLAARNLILQDLYPSPRHSIHKTEVQLYPKIVEL